MKKISIAFSLLLAFSLILAACSSGGSTSNNSGATGNTTGSDNTTGGNPAASNSTTGGADTTTGGNPASALNSTETPYSEMSGTELPNTGGLAASTAMPTTSGGAIATPKPTSAMSTAKPTTSSLGPKGTASPAMTVSPNATKTTGGTLPNTGGRDAGRLTNLMTMPIQDLNGQQVGNVQDLVLNFDTFMIDYAVVSLGSVPYSNASGTQTPRGTETPAAMSGSAEAMATTTPGAMMNAGGRTILVPWRFLRVNNPNQPVEALMINADASVLEAAPVVVVKNLNMNTDGWDQLIRKFWNNQVAITGTTGAGTMGPTKTAPKTIATSAPTAAAGKTTQTAGRATTTMTPGGIGVQPTLLASQLIGYPINDMKGGSLGTVRDALLDLTSGEIRYLVVEPAASLNAGGKVLLVPPQALPIRRGQTAFTFGSTNNAFVKAPLFDMTDLPNTTKAGWDKSLNSYWQDFIQMFSTPAP